MIAARLLSDKRVDLGVLFFLMAPCLHKNYARNNSIVYVL